jgi:superfamily II DNA or RNA helicase
MEPQVNQNHTLSFLFTPQAFLVDKAFVSSESWSRTGGEDELNAGTVDNAGNPIRNTMFSAKFEKLQQAFQTDPYQALWQLSFTEPEAEESPSLHFLHVLAQSFLEQLTAQPELAVAREKTVAALPEDVCHKILQMVPFGLGTEYIDAAWLRRQWLELGRVFSREMAAYPGPVAKYLAEKNPRLRVPERIFFHLVESKATGAPFAFLATYTSKDAQGNVRHQPLLYALSEYKSEHGKLLELLSCLNKAAEESKLVAELMASGEMFHPLSFTAKEAYTFLKDIPVLEKAGILCRVPNWWKKRAASVSLSVKLGEKKSSLLGLETLVSLQPSLMVDGQELTPAEIKQLLSQTEGLAFLKGKWVEVDHARLQQLLQKMQSFESELSLRDALQLNSGVIKDAQAKVEATYTNGRWLEKIFANLRQPEAKGSVPVTDSFAAILRPYQKIGFNWLSYISDLGFGACLADDMGLGKTVQILAYLDRLRLKKPQARVLLVVPASLLGNWQKETSRFAPEIKLQVLHGQSVAKLEQQLETEPVFLTLTTYGMAVRLKGLQKINWACIVLDEAQAIKNPGTKQTKALKKLQSGMRIALTGTPIENDLSNLWSLFDFLNKGLLGTPKNFQDYTKKLAGHPEGYEHLKNMIAPFILRRLKSDRSIIADLPEKQEIIDYVSLSKKQVALYRKQVQNLGEKLNEAEGISRRGLVLASLMKLKQICNHPDQFLGQPGFAPDDSGKFALLRELCETIAAKRERVLVFTQFREMTEPLAAFLETVFGCQGLVLHGGVRVSKRMELVEKFNGEAYVPFLVLSVKAGGTGLNLTGANHVIHFDRWWNPAVENQATDRAFRIGQHKNVFVHKFVTTGTVEEKIDELINSKKALAENIIGAGGGETWLTDLSNAELMQMLKLEQ